MKSLHVVHGISDDVHLRFTSHCYFVIFRVIRLRTYEEIISGSITLSQIVLSVTYCREENSLVQLSDINNINMFHSEQLIKNLTSKLKTFHIFIKCSLKFDVCNSIINYLNINRRSEFRLITYFFL